MLVVGDVMLDRYWFGEVSRISPEAPVPVVHVERTEERPGGAANVARNSTALGGARDAAVGGRRGRGRRGPGAPAAGRGRAVRSCTAIAALATTVKLRVIGRQQQLLRIDFENAAGARGAGGEARRLRARLADCRRGGAVRLRQGRARARRRA